MCEFIAKFYRMGPRQKPSEPRVLYLERKLKRNLEVEFEREF